MKTLNNLWIAVNIFRTYRKGFLFLSNPIYLSGRKNVHLEKRKEGNRTETINLILKTFSRDTKYLEIGTRNPAHNFDHINANTKYSVDPGVEFKKNPVDFKMTSDEFFERKKANKILNKDLLFDVIFIDGLHLADQVNRDICNAFEHLSDDGFIILHDCNPPTEWHARETYHYRYSPAGGIWNGTSWKAYYSWRCKTDIYSICVDTDWGIGILSKNEKIGNNTINENPYYEFSKMYKNKIEHLNLVSFNDFKKILHLTQIKTEKP